MRLIIILYCKDGKNEFMHTFMQLVHLKEAIFLIIKLKKNIFFIQIEVLSNYFH